MLITQGGCDSPEGREKRVTELNLRPQGMTRALRKNKIFGKENVIRDYRRRSLLWGLRGISSEPLKRPGSRRESFLPLSN